MKIKLEERLGKKDLTIFDLNEIVTNFNSNAMLEVLENLKDDDNQDLKEFYSDLYHLGLQYKQKQLIKKGVF
ncbi:hypothetical protein [Fusobacterium massiliense]|uniref:hypothetical protein n=1 Tax=Fusobacterium massiliense TaxID=1852365 RepID=UPI0028E28F23|nr:hypothetical protein [Fusobacterium massiliense]